MTGFIRNTVGVASLVALAAAGMTTAGIETGWIDVQATSSVPAGCTHTQPCWNDYTMGRFKRCDVGAVLPRGEFFRVVWTPLPDTAGWQCGEGWSPAHVRVVVESADGLRDVAGADDDACVPVDPRQVGAAVNDLLPDLFRDAGARA